MKKILDLLKTEFIKNVNLKKIIIVLIVLVLSSLIIFKISKFNYGGNYAEGTKITQSDVENARENYNRSKKLFEELNNYESYIQMIKDEKFLKISELMVENGFTDASSNRFEIYNLFLTIMPDLSEYEAIINGYKETTDDINDIMEKYNKLKEEYDTALDALVPGDIYKIEKYNLLDYKEQLNIVNAQIETTQTTDYNLENQKKYLEEQIELSQYLIDNKINADDWQYTIVENITNLLIKYLIPMATEEEFNENRVNMYSYYENYEDYINQSKISLEKTTKPISNYKIILKENIKPIIMSNELSSTQMPYDIRIGFNNIYYMGIVILVICIISFGGMIANEHKTGSIRLLISNPFSRSKVLLSKYIYLILNALILYVISLLIFIIIMFVTGNIDSLSIPQMIVQNDVVTKTNYLLFIIKNIGIHFIFISFILTILFFLSSVSLNVALTGCTTLLITLLSVFIPLINADKINAIFSYVPFTFLNYSKYLSSNPTYNLFITQESNMYINTNINTCLISTIILIIIIYIIANIIYCKRDIKN